MRGTVSVAVVVLCVFVTHLETPTCSSLDDQQQVHVQELTATIQQKEGDHLDVDTADIRHRERRQASSNPDVKGFTKEQKKIIVDKHNTLRRIPKSSDMTYMYWDEDLAALAQAWSENCDFSHRPAEKRRDIGPYKYVGENLYASTGTYDPDTVIQLWYNEVEFYDYNTGCRPHSICGHYTQVVWAESRAVGCGVRYCPVLRNVDFDTGFLVTCNYGPRGNYRGERPYKQGEPCTACSKDEVFCVEGLCSKVPVITGGVMSHDQPCLLLIGCSLMSAILSWSVITWLFTPDHHP